MALRLDRLGAEVHAVDALDRQAGARRQPGNAVGQLGGVEFLDLIEQRQNHHRRDLAHHDRDDEKRRGRRQPPPAAGGPDQPVEPQQQDRGEAHGQQVPLRIAPQPAAEALRAQVEPVLQHVAGIERQGKRHDDVQGGDCQEERDQPKRPIAGFRSE